MSLLEDVCIAVGFVFPPNFFRTPEEKLAFEESLVIIVAFVAFVTSLLTILLITVLVSLYELFTRCFSRARSVSRESPEKQPLPPSIDDEIITVFLSGTRADFAKLNPAIIV